MQLLRSVYMNEIEGPAVATLAAKVHPEQDVHANTCNNVMGLLNSVVFCSIRSSSTSALCIYVMEGAALLAQDSYSIEY